MNKSLLSSLVIFIILVYPLTTYSGTSIDLIDSPATDVLAKGSYTINSRLYQEGGLLAKGSIGITERLLVGASYGGTRVIGYGDPKGNPRVEFAIKYKFLDDRDLVPTMSVGFDSQGYGSYDKDKERYEIKSKGFYLVASKRLDVLAGITFLGGINYSLETKDEKGLSLFIGSEIKTIPEFGLLLEYDTALNDESGSEGHGYFNLGIRWDFAPQLSLGFDFKNLFDSWQEVSRIFSVTYKGAF